MYKYGVYAVDCVSGGRVGADGCPAGHVETALLLPLTQLISETDCTPTIHPLESLTHPPLNLCHYTVACGLLSQ